MYEDERARALNRLLRKREAYRRLFYGPNGSLTKDGEIVLKDLRSYCRREGILVRLIANVKTMLLGSVDPYQMANANGRREVYDRIMKYLHLSDEKEIQLETPTED